MFRLAYRNFGDHETLVVNHAVAATAAHRAYWYEVRDPGGTPTIFQQGTYAPDGTFRWMASIAMDKAQNVLMGYSRSGPQIFPSVFFTGRSASGRPNQLAIEKAAVNGTGSQSNPDRWGDYSSMSLDPTDELPASFWFSTQYEGVTGQFNWQTSICPVSDFPTASEVSPMVCQRIPLS